MNTWNFANAQPVALLVSAIPYPRAMYREGYRVIDGVSRPFVFIREALADMKTGKFYLPLHDESEEGGPWILMSRDYGWLENTDILVFLHQHIEGEAPAIMSNDEWVSYAIELGVLDYLPFRTGEFANREFPNGEFFGD